jgi:hypothetical protein
MKIQQLLAFGSEMRGWSGPCVQVRDNPNN